MLVLERIFVHDQHFSLLGVETASVLYEIGEEVVEDVSFEGTEAHTPAADALGIDKAANNCSSHLHFFGYSDLFFGSCPSKFLFLRADMPSLTSE